MFIDSVCDGTRSVRVQCSGGRHGAPYGAQVSLLIVGYKHNAPPEQREYCRFDGFKRAKNKIKAVKEFRFKANPNDETH